jgi:membrane-associated phospholipid phosphatase
VKSGYKFPGKLSALDRVTIIYLVVSSLLIFCGWNILQGVSVHFAIRALLIGGILFLAWLNYRTENFWIEFVHAIYPLFFINYFYAETSFLKNIFIREILDPLVFRYEEVFFGCQPSIVFSQNCASSVFNEIMHFFYFSYYLLIISITILLYLKTDDKGRKGIFIVYCSFYIYYLIYALIPVVGPQYFLNGELRAVPRPYFFGKIMHLILESAEEPTGAFPSSHVGIAVILTWLAFRNFKRVLLYALPCTIGICFATVYLKAHYLLDVFAGIVSAPLLYLISSAIYRLFTRKFPANEQVTAH